MNKFCVIFGVLLLPVLFSACQTTGTGTSNFAGKNSTDNSSSGSRAKLQAESTEVKTQVAAKPVVGANTAKGRRKRYANLVAKHARSNGVPVRLAMAVVQVESNYKSNARGAAGEIGLMQLLPRTARFIGYKGSMKNLYNPDTNLRYGMKYLGKAYKLSKGSTCGAILRYNAGHGAKRMNATSRKYCNRVRRIMKTG